MNTQPRFWTATVAAVIFGIFVASPSLAATADLSSSGSEDAAVMLDQADETGFTAQMDNGHFEERSDGSVAIVDESNEDVAILDTELPLHNGEEATVEYSVTDGQTIDATFSQEVDPEELEWSAAHTSGAQARAAGSCATSALQFAGATAAGFGAALTAPMTAGGSLLVGGAAITGAATSVDFARDCYGS